VRSAPALSRYRRGYVGYLPDIRHAIAHAGTLDGCGFFFSTIVSTLLQQAVVAKKEVLLVPRTVLSKKY